MTLEAVLVELEDGFWNRLDSEVDLLEVVPNPANKSSKAGESLSDLFGPDSASLFPKFPSKS
jgi:hypothetical protein